MSFLADLVVNPIFVSAFAAWTIAQISKTITYWFVSGELDWGRLLGSGGMPSSHAATVCALLTATGYHYGASGFEFGFAMVLAFIVMHDAMGIRRQSGNQAKMINEMMEFLGKMGEKLPVSEKLKEFVGHTPIQVLAGAITGVATGLVVVNVLK
ncbi:MAG: divergent PAP2 family protein [Lachnospiraceae bacterium]|jgi:acid phosphatase family membrane protein YuiD|nr:divergent PAP2 family protein [Lachnospiraceae bacterium]